jgi:hypothetical protein
VVSGHIGEAGVGLLSAWTRYGAALMADSDVREYHHSTGWE